VSDVRTSTACRTTVAGMSADECESNWLAGGVRSARWRWTFGGAVWLIFLFPAFGAAVRSDHGPVLRALTLLDLVLFGAVYLVSVPLTSLWPLRDPRRYAVAGLVLLLGLLSLPGAGEEGLATFVYVAVVGVGLLPARVAIPLAGGAAALAAALTYLVPGWDDDPGGLIFSIVLATAASSAFMRLIRRNAELAVARGNLAAVAVEQERARFARDLHDLLGHSLTVITVKAELAGRLLDRDPARAAVEVADIERLAREALSDVRATVSGYRGVTLTSEISSARVALDAAGVIAELPGAVDDVPGERRELFGWVLREGVTNVLRHADAGRVRVSVSSRAVEIVDDGTGSPAGADGTGLAGLRERLSQVGGRLDAGPADGGGFRLYAEVPA
jgi:two-component system, NarL family, sensor histidine kinase DesK